MKAYEARNLAYEVKKATTGLKEVYEAIEVAARQGNFSIKLDMLPNWGDKGSLEKQLVNDGFIVELSDNNISISWNE